MSHNVRNDAVFMFLKNSLSGVHDCKQQPQVHILSIANTCQKETAIKGF